MEFQLQGSVLVRVLRRTALLLGATASCYLGLLASRFLWDSPGLLLALLTDAELAGVYRPPTYGALLWLSFLPPSAGSSVVAALYAGGATFLAALVLLLGPALLPRLHGWSRLIAAFAVLWLGTRFADAALVYADRGWGSFAGAMRMFGIGEFGGAGLRWALSVLACGLVLSAVYRIGRQFGSSTTQSRRDTIANVLIWLAGPILLLSLALPGIELQAFWLHRRGFFLLQVAVFTAMLLLAAWRPRRLPVADRYPAGMAGATWATCFSAVALAGTFSYPSFARWMERPQFETRAFRHWQVSFEEGALDAKRQIEWGEAADLRLETLAERLNLNLDAGPRKTYVYRSANSKRNLTEDFGDDSSFSIDLEQGAIHHLLSVEGDVADARGEALLLLADAWGVAGSTAVAEAVVRYAVGSFHGHPLTQYARRIACGEQAYPLREVLQVEPRYLSPLVRDALGGAWVESLVAEHGENVLRVVYQTPLAGDGGEDGFAQALGTTWDGLERQWQAYMRPPESCEPVSIERTGKANDEHRGISFSHEYGGGWGYGSDVAQRQLERIHRLGANAIAVVPYAFTRAPSSTRIRFRTDETDARVIRTIEGARHLGLRVTLKPHLWTGGFTGDIVFEQEKDFRVWFSQYRRWLLHFARMAALYDVELLVIGNELGGVTSYEDAWRSLIRDVRRIYRGPLTYGAHWKGEFERVTFWNDLDYVGVNFYFPLAERGEIPRGDSSRVEQIAARLEAVSQRFDRPVLFTEVGFPSVATAAAEPWAETGARIDLDLQRQCYEVVFEAFSSEPWFAGLYWWKWPTHGRGGPFDASHRPIGKPALEVIGRWYQRGSAEPDEDQYQR